VVLCVFLATSIASPFWNQYPFVHCLDSVQDDPLHVAKLDNHEYLLEKAFVLLEYFLVACVFLNDR
jgi:hypothetical protein